MATDKNKHLDSVLISHKIKKEQALLDKHVAKKDEVKEALEKHYGSNLYAPFNSGSYAKHTAMNTKFDFDLVAPYRRNAFETLKAMYDDVYEFLNDKYNSVAVVKKQKVSIGLEFFPDANGDVVRVDVVPGRELNKDQYQEDNNLNLYVYSQWGNIAGGSDRIKTNVRKQIQNVKDNADRESIRQIIRLLKIWKVQNGKRPKSFFLELITIKAFDNKTITGGLWDKLKAVMEYIRDQIKTISLPDPGNSGNNVADTLTDIEKADMSDDMKFMVERIEEDSDYIKTYFALNPKFPEDSDDKNGGQYGVKDNRPSVPPVVRFG